MSSVKSATWLLQNPHLLPASPLSPWGTSRPVLEPSLRLRTGTGCYTPHLATQPPCWALKHPPTLARITKPGTKAGRKLSSHLPVSTLREDLRSQCRLSYENIMLCLLPSFLLLHPPHQGPHRLGTVHAVISPLPPHSKSSQAFVF